MPKKRTIIEQTPDDQHPNRVIVEESIDPKDQPSVMAYRLGSLENTVKDGFANQDKKMDDLIKGFVTEKEFENTRKELWEAINGIKASTRWWVGTCVAIVAAIAALLLVVKKG